MAPVNKRFVVNKLVDYDAKAYEKWSSDWHWTLEADGSMKLHGRLAAHTCASGDSLIVSVTKFRGWRTADVYSGMGGIAVM